MSGTASHGTYDSSPWRGGAEGGWGRNTVLGSPARQQARLDRADRSRVYPLVADRPCTVDLLYRERTHGMRIWASSRRLACWPAASLGLSGATHSRRRNSAAATAPSTNTARTRFAAWSRSSRISQLSSTGCASPATNPSSTRSWPSGAVRRSNRNLRRAHDCLKRPRRDAFQSRLPRRTSIVAQ